jgi:hypothetical protein
MLLARGSDGDFNVVTPGREEFREGPREKLPARLRTSGRAKEQEKRGSGYPRWAQSHNLLCPYKCASKPG